MTSFILTILVPVVDIKYSGIKFIWQLFDILVPFTCPTVPACKIPLALLAFQLITSGLRKLKNRDHFETFEALFFISIVTSCCYHTHLLVEKPYLFNVIRASNERTSPDLWNRNCVQHF